MQYQVGQQLEIPTFSGKANRQTNLLLPEEVQESLGRTAFLSDPLSSRIGAQSQGVRQREKWPGPKQKTPAKWIHALSLRGLAQEMSGFWTTAGFNHSSGKTSFQLKPTAAALWQDAVTNQFSIQHVITRSCASFNKPYRSSATQQVKEKRVARAHAHEAQAEHH